MSLDWNVTKVANYEEVCFVVDGDGDRRLNPITEGIIFATMACGIGWGITEENVEEFVARVTMYEKVVGSLLIGADGPRPLTEDELRAHVGLHTNVSYEDRAHWLARTFANAFPKAIEPDDALRKPFEVVFTDPQCGMDYYVRAKDEDEAVRKARQEAIGEGYDPRHLGRFEITEEEDY